jgi:tRNA A-37 threonylcarbamoyl transferase component Bud32
MIGTRLGQYRIEALLGQGGMGAVYLATDEMLGRQVAIKVLREHSRDEDTAIERFRKEAQILARLDHPHILRLYGFSEDQGVLYMVTEYVQGEALQRRLELGVALEMTQVLEWASQILDALDYAHQLGVVHRDIKPANILIDERNRARLLDFGIARIVGGEGLTQTGHAVGTLTYMAPEQVLDEPIDGRADLYAFAVVLCQMFAGRRPYRSTTTAGLIREIVDGPLPDVASLLPSPALVFAPTLLHALARRPADRTATARRMREELIGAGKGAVGTATALPPLQDAAARSSSATAIPVAGTVGSGVTETATGAPVLDVHRQATATDARAAPAPPPRVRRAGALGLVVPALLLCAAAGVGWFVFRSSRPVTPDVVTAPARPDLAGSTSTTPPPVEAPEAESSSHAATSVQAAPPPPPPPGMSAPDRSAPGGPTARPPRSAAAKTTTVPAADGTTSAPPVAAAPAAPPTAVGEAPATSTAPTVAPTVPAPAEFKGVILIDRIDGEDEEIDATLRLDARRVVVLDEDGLAKRSIAYDAIARATYNTRRPGRFSIRRSASHWLTLEVGAVPVVLRLNSKSYEQVLTTLQGHGVNVERKP